MARRKTKDPDFSLFPFLSVMVAVMGTLILIITGMTQIGLASPKQRVEVDPFDATKKNPLYVECQRDGVLIHPDDPMTGAPVYVRRSEMDEPNSAFYEMMTRLQYDQTRYLQMLVRQDGVGTFNAVRAVVSDTGIDVGYEPLLGSGDVRFHPEGARAMSKRRNNDEVIVSLDSFLDIVTNVVGVLVLVAMVTVLSAGNISVPSGATAMTAPKPSASRLLFECAGDEVFFVDEEKNGARVLEEVKSSGQEQISRNALISLLDEKDVGDETHRVRADRLARGVAWVYTLRLGVHGEPATALEGATSAFQKRLSELERGGFAYFVVHDDSFAVFAKARDIARARGVSIGWHPVEGSGPVRLSSIGSLGRRIQ